MIRAIVDSVEKVQGKPANLAELENKLAAYRKRFPAVVIDRYLDQLPVIGEGVFVAEGAVVVGDVRLEDEVSIWYGCVLRGDVNRIVVGKRSNLQDGTVVHLGDQNPTIVGQEVVVGHRAVLHGCTVADGALIGIQATVLDGAVVGEGSIIGAGALVTVDMKIPPHSLVLGMPAKVIKTLNGEDEKLHRKLAGKYTRLAHNYLHG